MWSTVTPDAERVAVGVEQVGKGFQFVPLLAVMFVGEPARVRPFTRRLNLDKAHQRVANRNGIVWPRREVRKSAFTDKADGVWR